MINKIYAVLVYVNDVKESRRFYETVLEMPLKYQEKGWIEFDLGETVFAILQRESEQGPLRPQKTRIMLEVDDIGKAKQKLKMSKTKIIGDIRAESYGKLLTFEDPNGHWIEFYEPRRPGDNNT